MKHFIVAILAALALAPAAASAASTPPGTCTTLYGPKAIAEDPSHKVAIFRMDIAPGRVANWHTHPGSEYSSVVSGTGWLEVQGQPRVNLTPGSVFTIAPNVPHRVHNGSKSSPLVWTNFLILGANDHAHTVLKMGDRTWTPGCAKRV